MSNGLNIPIYINVGFDAPKKTADLKQLSEYVEDLKRSGFTTAIMFALHIDEQGNFTFGDPKNPPIVADGILQPEYSHLGELLWQMKYEGEMKTGVTINKLMFCLGGAGFESDFANAGKLLTPPGKGVDTLYGNFKALRDELYIEGIDLDFEGLFPSTDMKTALVQLPQMLSGPGINNYAPLNMETTYCPVFSQKFWFECLEDVYKANSKQPVSWWNLQCYAAGNTPEDWVTQFKQYSTGVDDPAAFVIPGYRCANPTDSEKPCQPDPDNYIYCPSGLQAQFSGLSQSDPGIKGGFLWSYAGIVLCQNNNQCSEPATTADYARAIIEGLNPKNK